MGWSDEEDFPGQFELWRSNVERSLRGARGQAALKDLEAALVALPEKRLAGHRLVKDGDVCANGALVAYRRAQQHPDLTHEQVLAALAEEIAPDCDACVHAKRVHGPDGCEDCPAAIARDVARAEEHRKQYGRVLWEMRTDICRNYVSSDANAEEDYSGLTEAIAEAAGVPSMVVWALVEVNDDLGYWRSEMTPTQRYDTVLAWTREHLLP